MEGNRAVSFEIRILRAGDEAFLNQVAPDVFDDPIQPRAAREFLADPWHHLVVAIKDGTVVGFASGVHYIHPDKPDPEFWINEVGVSADQRGRGIGKALMRAILGIAEDLGCREAWVLTDRDNEVAMRMYQSLGGEESPEGTVLFTYYL